ncbi:MAG TPA: phosphoribosyl-AMP cyclohydrolase [Actinomycetota bacterium]
MNAELKYDDKGLIPAVVQQHDTGEVLMVAWMNAESLQRTLDSATTWFWSRSRQEFWNKGATSGNLQHVKEVLYDCDGDTLLVKVDAAGPACHTGERTCFFRVIGDDHA